MKVAVVELGCPGHLIVAANCRWKRHTQIGSFFRVSSIGSYYPDRGERTTIGSGPTDFYESMVFTTTGKPDADNESCGCVQVKNWDEIDGRRYATAGEAQAGHERMVKKYRAKANRLAALIQTRRKRA